MPRKSIKINSTKTNKTGVAKKRGRPKKTTSTTPEQTQFKENKASKKVNKKTEAIREIVISASKKSKQNINIDVVPESDIKISYNLKDKIEQKFSQFLNFIKSKIGGLL